MPDTPPSTFPEMTDIPPVQKATSTTPQVQEPVDIPPMIASSQTPKKKSGRIIATILGILLLIGAVGAGVVLVGQKQLFQQKAAYPRCTVEEGQCVPDNYTCTDGKAQMDCPAGKKCGFGTCRAPTSKCTEGSNRDADCTQTLNGQQCPGKRLEYCKNGQWDNTQYPCLDIADNCPAATECTGYAVKCDPDNAPRGFLDCFNGHWRKLECVDGVCDPSTSNSTIKPICIRPACSLTGNRICVGNDVTGDCYQGGQGGQYACYKLTGDYGKVISDCANEASTCSCTCPSPYTWKAHENGHWWCFDTAAGTCDGQYPYAERCSLLPQQCTGGTPTPPPGATPTPTPTPGINAACSTVKAYDASWNLLTQAQLSALSAESVVRFTISGTPADQIDKARFTINGVLGHEITTKKPGTNEYYVEYIIPTGVYSFTVTAQIHHLTLGWF